MVEVVDGIAAGTAIATPQTGEPTTAPKLTLEDGRIRWDEPREAVLGRIRGVTPEPGAHTTLDGARLKLLAVSPAPEGAPPLAPGENWRSSTAQCMPERHPSPSSLELVQPAGKGAMRGRRLVARPARRRKGHRLMSASAPRRVAYDVLRAVYESDAYANLLLPSAIERARLSTADAALATELTYGTLRRSGTYDAVISIAADRPVQDIDPAVLDALRLGVHQLLSTRVASHAAVHESVELVRGAGTRCHGLRQRGPAPRLARHAGRLDDAGRAVRTVRRRAPRPASTRTPCGSSARSGARWPPKGRADELEALLTADNASPRVTMVALPGLAEVPDGCAAHAVLAARLPPRRR